MSTFDKTGLADLAHALHQADIELVASGGTLAYLTGHGLSVTSVSELTQCPEMLDGRVKTLHPSIHAGLLADRNDGRHLADLASQNIGLIDYVAVNLYPFSRAIKESTDPDHWLDMIDIGGSALLRAAAKNHHHVCALCDPSDYDDFKQALQNQTLHQKQRYWAVKAFATCSRYDQAIAQHWEQFYGLETGLTYPLRPGIRKLQDLRYGENPHQGAQLYGDCQDAGLLGAALCLQTPLSYNNLCDAQAAWELATAFPAEKSVAIVKHGNPCGAAIAHDTKTAFDRAFACDPSSAFGGIIAVHGTVDEALAHLLTGHFFELVLCTQCTKQAQGVLDNRPRMRLLEISTDGSAGMNTRQIRDIAGGWLVQEPDGFMPQINDWECVGARQPTAQEWQDLAFAYQVAARVKSNAIVFAKDQATLGIGAGQMSRIDAADIAVRKAQNLLGVDGDHPPFRAGTVVASDAFLPFVDVLEKAAAAGATAMVQPGGSRSDAKIIAYAKARNIALVFSGKRHFLH